MKLKLKYNNFCCLLFLYNSSVYITQSPLQKQLDNFKFKKEERGLHKEESEFYLFCGRGSLGYSG